MKYFDDNKRDLRIDMMRGVVMFMLVVVHIEVFSIFNYLAWERLGIITSAEGFVMFSGMVLGLVHRRIQDKKNNISESTHRLLQRSLQIYKANIAIVLILFILVILNTPGVEVITTFKNWSTGDVYSLIPKSDWAWNKIVIDIVMLKHSPHQVQILGLYVILLAISPFIIYLLKSKRWIIAVVLVVSAYLYQLTYPSRPSKAQFEYAFPLLAWQFIFYMALIAGYFFIEIKSFCIKYKFQFFVILLTSNVYFIFYAWNSPNPAFPDWIRFNYYSSEEFYALHNNWYSKRNLGFLRVINNVVFWSAVYAILSLFWKPINRFFGWLFVPVGQYSLYVFIMHIPVIYLLNLMFSYSNYPPQFKPEAFFLNSLIHLGAILILWLMVKGQFLFKYIPK